MAVHSNDSLSKIIGTDVISDRINSFVWISTTNVFNDLLTFNPNENNTELRKILAERLNQNPGFAEKIKKSIKNSLIPADELSWIKDNKRQIEWLRKYISIFIAKQNQIPALDHSQNPFQPFTLPQYFGLNGFATPFLIPVFLTARNRGIAIIDFWSAFYLPNAIFSIGKSKEMQSAWTSQMEKEKKFDWFNDENGEDKRNTFWNILVSKKILGISGNPGFHDHDEFLIYLDDLNFSDLEKDTISKETRNRWNQQRRREHEKDTKKQCNFNLTKAIDDKLTKLAKKYDLSRVDVIDILIRSEAKHESYIKAWLQRKPSENPAE